jgi:hypothetical protein
MVLRPLREGYYLVLALSPEANLGRGLHFSAAAKVDLDAEL